MEQRKARPILFFFSAQEQDEEDMKKQEWQCTEGDEAQVLSDSVENKRDELAVDNPGTRKATST